MLHGVSEPRRPADPHLLQPVAAGLAVGHHKRRRHAARRRVDATLSRIRSGTGWTVTDDDPMSDSSPQAGALQAIVSHPGTWTICENAAPAGYVKPAGQPCAKVVVNWGGIGWGGSFVNNLPYSMNWGVTEGVARCEQQLCAARRRDVHRGVSARPQQDDDRRQWPERLRSTPGSRRDEAGSRRLVHGVRGAGVLQTTGCRIRHARASTSRTRRRRSLGGSSRLSRKSLHTLTTSF